MNSDQIVTHLVKVLDDYVIHNSNEDLQYNLQTLLDYLKSKNID